jgi:hypothetical protein
MRVPFANTPYPIHIAGIAGRNGVPEKSGRGTISMYGKYIPDADEYTTHNGDAYNWRTGMKTYTPAYGMLGRGVIDQLNNVGYTAQAYNQTNLGANGVVRVK